jgi:gliding motility-associated-like protein
MTKTLISFFIFMCFFESVSAQDNWLRRGGGTNIDEALDLTKDNSENSFICGYFSGTSNIGGEVISSNGQTDAFVFKSAPDGDVLWARKYGGSKNDRANAAITDNDGNIYVTGFFTDEADFGGTTLFADSGDVFVAKINTTGALQWVRRAGGLYSDVANGIATDNQGNVVITGQFRGTADFGPFDLVSSGNSMDIFIAKLDANGNWLWSKGGQSAGIDRGLDVATDDSGNIYACGQFSDDITFDVLHTNDVVNAGYLIKLNASGVEQWFSSIVAGQVLPNAVRCDSQGNAIITGESIGQMIFFGTNMEVLPFSNSFSIFLAKYSSTGSILWSKEDGSENNVSSKALCIGPQNEIYLTGTFRCAFTEYNEESPGGLFYSAGYRDIFLTRYNTDGTRIWQHQIGGPRDEFCSGIDIGNTSDRPVVAGSFEKFFHIPANSGFLVNTTLWIPDSQDDYFFPNSATLTCSGELLGYWNTVEATGNKDVFYTSPYHSTVGSYLYFEQNGSCGPDYVEPCIGISSALECGEDTEICNETELFFVSQSGSNCFIGPEYDLEWNNGSGADNITASETGWYWITMEREDGCYTETDSVHIEVHPLPIPTITDSEGVNIEVPPNAETIFLCAPDEVILTGGNTDGNSFWWGTLEGNINQTSITVSESGDYFFNVQDEFGCIGVNSIHVELIDPLDTIVPFLELSGYDLSLSDTVDICGDASLYVDLDDFLLQEDFANYTDSFWEIYVNGQMLIEYEGQESTNYSPLISGWYTFISEPFLITPLPCVPDTVFYPPLELEFYVNLLATPDVDPILVGETDFCPGDTILLQASNAPNYTWNGPSIIEYINDSTVLVNAPGNYSVGSYLAYENGCDDNGSMSIVIPEPEQPEIYPQPEHAVICPGDSLLLVCEEGLDYQWVGPLGQDLGNESSIYISDPGYYYCLQTNFIGCTLESNLVEAQEFSTPYLLGYPSSDLCVTGYSTLFIQTYPEAIIEWQSPLSGSNAQQTVFDPGIYTAEVNFCDITTEVSIEVSETVLNPVIVGENNALCPGEQLSLSTLSGMASYQWNPGGQNTETVVISSAGSYTVSVEDTLGCEGTSAPFNVTVNNIQSPTLSDQMVCMGENLNLVASSGEDVFWATDQLGTNVIATGNLYSLNEIIEELILYVFAEDESCTSLPNEIQIGIWPSSISPIAEGDSTLCMGEAITLNTEINEELEYEWTLPNGSSNDDMPFMIETSSISQGGWYVLESSDTHCSAFDSIYVTVENPFNTSLLLESEFSLCIGGELMLESNLEADGFEWLTPGGIQNDEILVIDEVSLFDEGNYILTVPGTYCDVNFDSMYVEVVEYPVINLADSTIYCDSGYMIAHLPSGYDQYLWSNGDTGNESIVPLNGEVIVTVTNFPNCSVTDSTKVEEIDCISTFPNVFTPDGDQYNQMVDFGWLRIPIDEVFVYNRWGNLVRHLTKEAWIWRGETDWNTQLPEGVYYYIVKSPNPGKQFPNLSGYIHLLRVENGSGNN